MGAVRILLVLLCGPAVAQSQPTANPIPPAPRATLDVELRERAVEIGRLQGALEALRAERGALVAAVAASQQEHARLHAELGWVTGSATWRLREKALRLPLVGTLYRMLARTAALPRSVHARFTGRA
jgi:hypothetical protein